MENLRKARFFALVVAVLLMGSAIHAQTRVKNTPVLVQGQTIEFGGAGGIVGDSLQVSDSIGYLIPVSHTNNVDLFSVWQWSKIGAGTATLTINFYQSMDNVNWQAVPKGAAGTAYTKAYSLSASGYNVISFAQDTARFEGRYLKALFFTTSTASVKGKLDALLKASIK